MSVCNRPHDFFKHQDSFINRLRERWLTHKGALTNAQGSDSLRLRERKSSLPQALSAYLFCYFAIIYFYLTCLHLITIYPFILDLQPIKVKALFSKNNLAGKVINFKRTVYMKQYNQSFVPYFTMIETDRQFIRAEIRQ